MNAQRILPPMLILFASIMALATTVVPASVEHLTQESSHVLIARAVDSRALWDANHTRIYTYTRFQAIRQIAGSLPATFLVKRLGGHLEGYTMKVAGVRGWQPGEYAVLFLQRDNDGTYVVTGLMQGDFRIAHRPSGAVVVSNGVRGAQQLEASGQIRQYRGAEMSLQELEQRVRKAAGR